MIDLRKDSRRKLRELELGERFIDEFGELYEVSLKEYRDGALVMSYSKVTDE